MTRYFCRKLQELGLMVKFLPKTKRKYRPTCILTPFSLYNRSLTYRKLPEQNLKLSVLKLDGSSFSFHVARNATVAILKFAVEEEFSLFPKEEREKLWALVWSNFCLCYEGQKLIRDTALIKRYGIKDGDQLYFIQHLRIDHAPTPQLSSKNLNTESKECPETRARDARANNQYTDEGSASPERRSSLSHSLMGLLPCSKFQHSTCE